MTIHQTSGPILDPEHIVVGESPLNYSGKNIAKQFRYLLNWAKQQQIFTFAGPGPLPTGIAAPADYYSMNPDWNFTGNSNFAIVTRLDKVRDDLYHRFHTDLTAWRYKAGATVTYEHRSSGAPVEMWRSYEDSHKILANMVNMYSVPNKKIVLNNSLKDPGLEDYGWCVNKLAYTRMMVGSLSVSVMPDYDMSHIDLTLIDEDEFDVGKILRSFNTVGFDGIGNLIKQLVNLEQITARCLLQSGVPTYIASSNSDEFCNLRNGYPNTDDYNSAFRVQPRRLFSGVGKGSPFVVACAAGATVEDPAQVRFTSLKALDSKTINITSDAEALYYAEGLEIHPEEEFIRIELLAPPFGSVGIKTYGVYEEPRLT
jgi:hypothetical protein